MWFVRGWFLWLSRMHDVTLFLSHEALSLVIFNLYSWLFLNYKLFLDNRAFLRFKTCLSIHLLYFTSKSHFITHILLHLCSFLLSFLPLFLFYLSFEFKLLLLHLLLSLIKMFVWFKRGYLFSLRLSWRFVVATHDLQRWDLVLGERFLRCCCLILIVLIPLLLSFDLSIWIVSVLLHLVMSDFGMILLDIQGHPLEIHFVLRMAWIALIDWIWLPRSSVFIYLSF